MLAFTSCFHFQVTPPDAATSDRQLAYGKKMLTGVYGTLVDDVTMTAIVTVRWSLMLLND